MNALARALVAEHFGEQNGELAIGGIAASALAAAHGTPMFVYDAGVLRRRLALLRATLPARVAVFSRRSKRHARLASRNSSIPPCPGSTG